MRVFCMCCASKKIPFTGRYDAATKKGVFCSISIYVNNGPQYLLKEKNDRMNEHTHTLTHMDEFFITKKANAAQKKYVSHYSNKNGQFILWNVQILCIIYITFLASAFFPSIPLDTPRTHIFLLYTYKTCITFYSFVFLLRLTLTAHFTVHIRWRWCISMCVLFVMFTIFCILWKIRRKRERKKRNKHTHTHDVTLSSFICLFCADAWSLWWFRFSFRVLLHLLAIFCSS